MFYRALFAGLLLVCSAGAALAQTAALESFAAEPSFESGALSPAGDAVAGIRHRADRDELVIFNRATNQTQVLLSAFDAVNEHLDWVDWKSDTRLLVGVRATITIYARAQTGSRARADMEDTYEVSRVVAINRDGSNRVVLFEGQQRRLAHVLASTRLVSTMRQDPQYVLLSAYGATDYALWQVDVNTGRATEIVDGNEDTFGWVTDINGAPVMRYDWMDDYEGYRAFRRAGDRWVEAFEVRGGSELALPEIVVWGRAPDPGMIWITARAANEERASLRLYNTADGAMGPPVHENARADIRQVNFDPISRRLLAACANVERIECQYFDPTLGRHLRAVSSFFDNAAEIELIDAATDNSVWLLYVNGPTIPHGYYTYDRAATRVDFVAAETDLTEAQLSPSRPFTYRSRDGVDLWGYLTVPRNAPATGAPLIVMPHGGPESRDSYGYDALVQFLASRGYLVFQPQFRGSAGFGRTFQEAGRRQWGQRMQDDVTDGVRALIDAGTVDAGRICIVGGSYGGYAALAGATFTPELYRCAVSIAGVFDLPESLRTDRNENGRRSAFYDYWRLSMGDLGTDREMLERFSPSMHADQVRAPILLIHGEEDDTVPIEQSEIMDRALRAADKNVRFVRLRDTDHYILRWKAEHRLTLYREIDRFLIQHLPPR